MIYALIIVASVILIVLLWYIMKRKITKAFYKGFEWGIEANYYRDELIRTVDKGLDLIEGNNTAELKKDLQRIKMELTRDIDFKELLEKFKEGNND